MEKLSSIEKIRIQTILSNIVLNNNIICLDHISETIGLEYDRIINYIFDMEEKGYISLVRKNCKLLKVDISFKGRLLLNNFEISKLNKKNQDNVFCEKVEYFPSNIPPYFKNKLHSLVKKN